jgi:hypothetical protein
MYTNTARLVDHTVSLNTKLAAYKIWVLFDTDMFNTPRALRI